MIAMSEQNAIFFTSGRAPDPDIILYDVYDTPTIRLQIYPFTFYLIRQLKQYFILFLLII